MHQSISKQSASNPTKSHSKAKITVKAQDTKAFRRNIAFDKNICIHTIVIGSTNSLLYGKISGLKETQPIPYTLYNNIQKHKCGFNKTGTVYLLLSK